MGGNVHGNGQTVILGAGDHACRGGAGQLAEVSVDAGEVDQLQSLGDRHGLRSLWNTRQSQTHAHRTFMGAAILAQGRIFGMQIYR